MNYNSWAFWLLFLVVYLLYWRLNHRQQNTLLLIASYAFYGFWDYRFLFLILLSTVIDFIGGLGVAGLQLPTRRLRQLAVLLITSSVLLCTGIQYGEMGLALSHLDMKRLFDALPHDVSAFYVPLGTAAITLAYGCLLPWLYACSDDKRRKYFLSISMVANLAILGFFKYCDFFLVSFENLLETMGFGHLTGHTLGIILPAGISFYTFQAMSYTIDIYRGEAEPTDNFRDFALFVCFFPHLVAGPIMRASTLLPQVLKIRERRPSDGEEGLLLVVLGLFKKIVIADNMAPIANAVFYPFMDGATSALPSGPEVLVGLYAFAFQIYGDFSGYSCIARGISKWLGFDLMINFHLPYLAVSPSDFWHRWHISLSSWLRDYLYIPLGGSRSGSLLTYRNLFLTMLLGGLWHGANWTFVVWGCYHGTILCIFRLLNISDQIGGEGISHQLRWLMRVVLMFHLTCLGWLLFRADSMSMVVQMASQMLANHELSGATAAPLFLIGFYCALLFGLESILDGENRLTRLLTVPWMLRGTVYVYLVAMLVFFPAEEAHEFIYFQF